jgi:O-antigen ligase
MLKHVNIITVLLLFFWLSFFPAPVQEKYYLVTEVFLAFAFVILLIREGRSIFSLDDFPLWFFLVAISINVFFAQQREISLSTYLNLAIPLFLVYYLSKEAFYSKRKFILLTKTICISSILVALGGVLESLFAFNPLYEHVIKNPYYKRYITGFVRPMSTQFNPVILGSYLLGSLPFHFLLFKQSSSFFRLLGIAGIVLSTAVIILTFSRGVLLGLIAMVAFYLVMNRRYKAVAIFFIMLFVFISICSYLPYPFNRFGQCLIISEQRGILSSYRFIRCAMTQQIVKDHPLAGLGFQHFRIRFYEYYPRIDIVPYEFMIADNMYLTILAETGVIGFLGFFIFIFLLLKKAWKRLKTFNFTSIKRWQLAISLTALIGLLVNMGGYELFYWPNPYMFFCILVGIIRAFSRNRIG